METLITCQKISKSWGSKPVFQDLSLSFGAGEKTGLTGSNGTGKSTLINILAGKEAPDHGQVTFRRHLKTGLVPQVPRFPEGISVMEAALRAAAEASVAEEEREINGTIMLSQAGFTDLTKKVGELSGGWQKRLAICCGCLGQPDFVFFDEPTNHLDWDGIRWLEEFLRSAEFGWLTISHDRYLLNSVVTKVTELSPRFESGFLTTDGPWESHLSNREAVLEADRQQYASMQNKLRREEAWLHQGIKARGTRAKHRVDAAEKLRSDVQKSHERQKTTKTDIEFAASGRKTKKLIEIKEVMLSLGGNTLLKKFSTQITAKTRTGILGPNGCGKTSLFRLLMGELKPGEGELVPANQLEIVCFDQQREQLDPEKTLRRTLCEHGDKVIFQDRQIHINSWAKRFGFSAERLEVPVEKLSGGEQARVLIARLMLRKADLLLLDEPTNDLDIQTIEILEESLRTFPGAVVVISHDRYFLKSICDSFLGFGKNSQVLPFASVEQWLLAGQESDKGKDQTRIKVREKASSREPSESSKPKKLSYKEQREYEQMESSILAEESRLEDLNEQAGREDIISQPEKLRKIYEDITKTQEKIDAMYKRWSELEERA